MDDLIQKCGYLEHLMEITGLLDNNKVCIFMI